METYSSTPPLWDPSFSQLPNDDFIALLQKQFPSNLQPNISGIFQDNLNPQSISYPPLPALTPPSEDSSPSPPNVNNEPSTNRHLNIENDDPALKRKALDDDDVDDEGPNQKNQHISNDRKTTSRRKSNDLGGGGGDQSRLLKRKEQNRAAQRAFRERKEKHVKDLEDRVASLEAKNEQAVSENENLRDLLSRLQNENVMLKEATFTFSVPKNGMNSIEPPPPSTIYGSTSPMSHDSPLNLFDNMSSSSSITSSPPAPPQAVFPDDPFDWNSLMSFDPAALTLLDENPQYATADMSVDFGAPLSPKLPYTTIASNPAFMSFADAFDGSSNIPISDINFDMPPWNTSPQSTKGTHDMFNGNGYMPQQNGPLDYGIGLSPPSSVSPVLHGTAHPNLVASSSSSSDPSTTSMFTKPGDGTASIPDEPVHKGACPNSKEALEKHIVAAGPSPFAPTPSLRKSANEQAGPIIDCQGAVLPQIEKSDQNIEVLAALRSITSNPMFKDADLTELCSEFTKKAKCDGQKVVLEPQGVNHIIETLTKQRSLS